MVMLYDAVCRANLQSVIRYPYPIRIRGIVEHDIRIYLYPQKFTDIRKYLSAVAYPCTSGVDCLACTDQSHLCNLWLWQWPGHETEQSCYKPDRSSF